MEILYAMLISVIVAGIVSIYTVIYFDKIMNKKITDNQDKTNKK